MYSKYPNFIKALLNSTGYEVRFLINITLKDQRSFVCIQYMNKVYVYVMTLSKWELKRKMPFQSKEKPESWRMSLLTTLVFSKINKTWSDL